MKNAGPGLRKYKFKSIALVIGRLGLMGLALALTNFCAPAMAFGTARSLASLASNDTEQINSHPSVRLYVWERGDGLAPIVIPVLAGQSPLQAWQSYVAALAKSTTLSSLTPMVQFVSPNENSFAPLVYRPEKNSLFIANERADLNPQQQRVGNWGALIQERGMKNHVLPPAVAIFLPVTERASFYAEIAAHFSLLLPVGGADVDPSLYDEPVKGARGFNGSLDNLEKELIAHYIAAEKGFLYATCRGAQLTAVSLGYRMVQDIPTEIKNYQEHWSSPHEIELLPTKNNLVRKIWGDQTVSVYSNHHQAIEYRPGGSLELAAKTTDGVAEVLELKNGRGLLIQSHPELTLGGFEVHADYQSAKKVFDWFVPQAQKLVRFTCSKIF